MTPNDYIWAYKQYPHRETKAACDVMYMLPAHSRPQFINAMERCITAPCCNERKVMQPH